MIWTAVVPLKQGKNPKSRLSSALLPSARVKLGVQMAMCVIEALRACRRINQVLLFSPVAPPALIDAEWCEDQGLGLNIGLACLRRNLVERALLVISGDVPLVDKADIDAMLNGAEKCGHALAPDRHDLGTNAVAIMPGQDFSFAFGKDSFARHRAGTPRAAIIRRPGLAIDVDTPDDLAMAKSLGFKDLI